MGTAAAPPRRLHRWEITGNGSKNEMKREQRGILRSYVQLHVFSLSYNASWSQ